MVLEMLEVMAARVYAMQLAELPLGMQVVAADQWPTVQDKFTEQKAELVEVALEILLPPDT
jgi:hypothetical protein